MLAKLTLFIVLSLTSLRAEGHEINMTEIDGKKICLSRGCIITAGYLLQSQKPTIDPCEDFYHYACGGWIDSVTIPKDKTGYTRLSEFGDIISQKIRTLMAQDHQKFTDDAGKMVKMYFDKCVEPEPLKQLVPEFLNVFRDIVSEAEKEPTPVDGLATLLGTSTKLTGQMALLNPEILTAGTEYYLNFRQPVLALLSPSRYNLTNPANEEIHEIYKNTLKFLAEVGASELNLTLDQDKIADEILEFESKLADILAPQSSISDPNFTYNLMSLSDIRRNFTFVDWPKWLKALLPPDFYAKFNDQTKINIQSLPYVKGLNDLVGESKPGFITVYVLSQIALKSLENLNLKSPILEKFFTAVKGVKELPSLEQGCLDKTVKDLGKHLVGKLFVDNFFEKDGDKTPQEMIKLVQSEMEGLLKSADWMDEETIGTAVNKLSKMVINTGFPEFYNDKERFEDWHKQLKLDDRMSSFEMARAVAVWKNFVNYYNHLFRPVDQNNDWFIGPRWVTAYHNVEANSILFPAGIMSRPVFSKEQPAALTYGALGSVIGKQITHGFDQYGRHYDDVGKLKDWMPEEAVEKFDAKKECFKDQYSKFRIQSFPDEVPSVNLTVAHDVADNGGVKMAFAAFKKLLEDGTYEDLRLPGLANMTPEQLFFLGWANFHCAKFRPDVLPSRLHNGHSYQEFRVKGPLANSPHFAEAYNCPAGSPMNPEKKCTLW